MTAQLSPSYAEITLREMTAADLPACHGLSQAVSWSHRLEDWQLAFRCGKGWVAEANGRVVGSALYWAWGKKYATLGLVIVSPDFQGRGMGKKLLVTLLGKLEGKTVRLHATPEGFCHHRRDSPTAKPRTAAGYCASLAPKLSTA
jgi:ribosomal protein S18 acetylase RimI-like enzyme